MPTQTSTARRTVPPPAAVSPPPPPARFTVEQYHRMDDAGVFDGGRYELIDGLIVEMPVVNPPHKAAVRQLADVLRPLAGTTFLCDVQAPITLAGSEPQPDYAVSIGPAERYATRHAGPGDVVFVVEVSDRTLAYDRGVKLRLYAAARIPVYWVVNIPDRVVEVYTQPRGGKNPAYRTRTDYPPGTDIPVVLRGTAVGTVPAAAVLPGA
jgi:Uma2 family endonuclease